MEDIQKFFNPFDITKYFDAVITGFDCQHSKPDPEIYLTVACAIGASPASCIVIEDSEHVCMQLSPLECIVLDMLQIRPLHRILPMQIW